MILLAHTGRRGHFPFLRVKPPVGDGIWYAQLRRIFIAETTTEPRRIVFLVRWAQLCPLNMWDATKQPLLRWEKAQSNKHLPGLGSAFFQLIDKDAVLESVTVVPKPFPNAYSDTGDINLDERLMWVHTVGYSALGET